MAAVPKAATAKTATAAEELIEHLGRHSMAMAAHPRMRIIKILNFNASIVPFSLGLVAQHLPC